MNVVLNFKAVVSLRGRKTSLEFAEPVGVAELDLDPAYLNNLARADEVEINRDFAFPRRGLKQIIIDVVGVPARLLRRDAGVEPHAKHPVGDQRIFGGEEIPGRKRFETQCRLGRWANGVVRRPPHSDHDDQQETRATAHDPFDVGPLNAAPYVCLPPEDRAHNSNYDGGENRIGDGLVVTRNRVLK